MWKRRRFPSRAVRLVTCVAQIDILNSSYSTTRFAFTYAWWSAYGFSRHVKSNAAEAAEMKLIDQEKVRCNAVGVDSVHVGKVAVIYARLGSTCTASLQEEQVAFASASGSDPS